jgi:hypothetical protein
MPGYTSANIIEQTFAVILHSKATSASRRLYFLGPFKEKKSTRKKAKSENCFFFFFFVLDTLSFFWGRETHFWMINCVKMTNSASEWT